jgi:hypothetical protein
VKWTLLMMTMLLLYIMSVSVVLITHPSLSVAVMVDVGVLFWRNVEQAWATVLELHVDSAWGVGFAG